MRVLRIAVVTAFSVLVASRVLATENPNAASLAFLTGLWRGTSSSGAAAEELISTPEGGVMLSAGREFKDGKCVFYDLVVFASPKGTLTLIPHPGGKPSADVFPLLAFDATTKRATFENNAHDFPKKFVYELTGPNHLRITLTGEIKGVSVTETYNLTKAP